MRVKVKNPIIKPFLKWAGGKRQLIPQIKKNMPKKYNNYYEVFLGGGAVLFSIQPSYAIINDSNKELINCYEVIRDHPDELIEELKIHKNDKDYFYEIRGLDRSTKKYNKLSSIQRASRIIYLNKTCYNGLFRVNSQGEFNVPYGKYKNPDIVNEAVIKAVSKYLRDNKIEILNQDFSQALNSAQKGDFIYLDPPYDPVSDTASFTGYDINGFHKEDQRRLKELVDQLHEKGCKILLSNSYTDFIRDLYKDTYYKQTKISAIRSINSQGNKRGKVDEILVKNYE